MPPKPNTNFILYSFKEIYGQISVLGKTETAYSTLFPLKVVIKTRGNYLGLRKVNSSRKIGEEDWNSKYR